MQKILNSREVDEVTDRMGPPIRLEQVTNGGAIGVAARERREILEAQSAVRLFNCGQDDVGGVQAFGVRRASRRSRFSQNDLTCLAGQARRRSSVM